MKPGVIVSPGVLMTVASSGISTSALGPTATIRLSRTRIVPFLIVPASDIVTIFPPTKAVTCDGLANGTWKPIANSVGRQRPRLQIHPHQGREGTQNVLRATWYRASAQVPNASVGYLLRNGPNSRLACLPLRRVSRWIAVQFRYSSQSRSRERHRH